MTSQNVGATRGSRSWEICVTSERGNNIFGVIRLGNGDDNQSNLNGPCFAQDLILACARVVEKKGAYSHLKLALYKSLGERNVSINSV